MRVVTILLLAGAWGLAAPAQAGLYNSLDGPPAIPVIHIKRTVAELRGLATPLPPERVAEPGTLRYNYTQLQRRMEQRQEEGTLTDSDRASLGSCYIRFNHVRDAIKVLSAGNTDHFQIQANLAIAYHELGDLRLAIKHQEKALELWPAVHAGWSTPQLNWFRRADRLYLKLLQSRWLEEERRGGGRPGAGVQDKGLVPLDNLFPGVKFVGPDGKTYQAGALDLRSLDQLPPDAYNQVLQLVIWLPRDTRLYWYLAELLNAGGSVEPAQEILKDLDFEGLGGTFENLREHRRTLDSAVTVMRALRPVEAQAQLLACFAVPSMLAPPGVGAVSQGVAAVSPLVAMPAMEQGPAMPPSEAAPPLGPPNILPAWRDVTVGFLSGCLVAVLLGLQWQEWRRRRNAALEAAAAHAPPPVPSGPSGERSQGVTPPTDRLKT